LIDASLDQKKIKMFSQVNKDAVKISEIYPVPKADTIVAKDGGGSLKKEL